MLCTAMHCCRVKHPLWEIEEGFEPMNPAAYLRRYGHQLGAERRAEVEQMAREREAEPEEKP